MHLKFKSTRTVWTAGQLDSQLDQSIHLSIFICQPLPNAQSCDTAWRGFKKLDSCCVTSPFFGDDVEASESDDVTLSGQQHWTHTKKYVLHEWSKRFYYYYFFALIVAHWYKCETSILTIIALQMGMSQRRRSFGLLEPKKVFSISKNSFYNFRWLLHENS